MYLEWPHLLDTLPVSLGVEENQLGKNKSARFAIGGDGFIDGANDKDAREGSCETLHGSTCVVPSVLIGIVLSFILSYKTGRRILCAQICRFCNL